MIKIGISACFFYPDVTRKVFGPKSLSYVENDMFQYVAQQGVLPVLIPDLPFSKLETILNEFDGFVFQGGNDLAPESYDAKPLDKERWAGDRYRDDYELRILEYAIESDRPVLAICRGMQLLNVFFGGSLYQDIGTEIPNALVHRDAIEYDNVRHAIRFTGDNTLSDLYRDFSEPIVNSVHHQAVKEVGAELDILAVSEEDGIVEALEYRNASPGKVLGVQWHPEFAETLKEVVLPADRLMNHFLQQVKESIGS